MTNNTPWHHRYWVDDFSQAEFRDFVDEAQMLYFTYADGKTSHDYLIEAFTDGYLIADPLPYYDHGGDPNDPQFQYPESFHAKTPQELYDLPFVAGKTVFEQWHNLRFWNF